MTGCASNRSPDVTTVVVGAGAMVVIGLIIPVNGTSTGSRNGAVTTGASGISVVDGRMATGDVVETAVETLGVGVAISLSGICRPVRIVPPLKPCTLSLGSTISPWALRMRASPALTFMTVRFEVALLVFFASMSALRSTKLPSRVRSSIGAPAAGLPSASPPKIRRRPSSRITTLRSKRARPRSLSPTAPSGPILSCT